MFHRRENCPSAPESKVEERSASNPGPGHNASEREVHALESVDYWLPPSSGTEGSRCKKEASLGFGDHVDVL